MKRLNVAGFMMIFALAAVFSGCSGNKSGTVEIQRPEVQGVTIMTAGKELVDYYYETSGTVKAKYVSVLSSRITGAVTAILVKQGQRVEAGQLLLTIDDRDTVQQVSAAGSGYQEAVYAVEAAYQNKLLADVTYERYKKLFEQNAISHQDLDRVATQQKVAAANYKLAREAADKAGANTAVASADQAFTQITSPTAGIVTEKKIDVGSMAVAGMPLLVVDDDSSFTLETNVDERLMPQIQVGMLVGITIDSLGKTMQGTVLEIAPAVDPATRTFLLKIDLGQDKKGLRTGLYAKVRIATGKNQTIVLPTKAIVEKGELTGVYVVNSEGVIAYRLIKAGKSYGNTSEILSGVQAGDKVIVGGVEKAVDGGVVKGVSLQ